MTKVCLFLLVFAILVGCGGDDKGPEYVNPKYHEMKNVLEAPEALKQAARAIVKLQLGNNTWGTATFISPDGLILTNNHVLGIENNRCALEGCHIEIYLNFQIGSEFKKMRVFAEPLQVSSESDVAIYQLWTDAAKTQKLTSPHHLVFDPLTPAQLKGRTVHVIGHPHSAVKKWTTGQVYNEQQTWFRSTNYVLPGNSGSPYLNDEGKIIGILHRLSLGNQRITRRDVLYYAIGTASAELVNILNRPRNNTAFFSIYQPHSVEDIVKNQEPYLMAHHGEAIMSNGVRSHVLDLLGGKCDELIQKPYFLGLDDLDKELQACSQSWFWFNCLDPNDGKDYKKCPAGSEKDKWVDRFKKLAEKARTYNSHMFYRWLVSPWRLESSQASSTLVATTLLNDHLTRFKPPLTFILSTYLVDFLGPGGSAADFIKNYRNVPNYQYDYDYIIEAYEMLYDKKGLSRDEIVKAMGEMFADDKLDVGSKLELETMAYRKGLL